MTALFAGNGYALMAPDYFGMGGDASSPDQGGTSRLVDSSTTRVELRLWHDASQPGWQILVAGRVLPMRQERDALGEVAVYGLRYRSFEPHQGMHPTLGSQAPLRLRLRHPAQAEDHLVTLNEWRPDGGHYDGLPKDLEAAQMRRAQRVVVQTVARDGTAPAAGAPQPEPGSYAMDLRWLGAVIPA